jgi:hypothetical protein
MNYFCLLSKIDYLSHLCDDFKWRKLETAVAHDCLMTFSSRRAAQEFADAHELHAEPVDIRDLTHPEAIDGIENYLSI